MDGAAGDPSPSTMVLGPAMSRNTSVKRRIAAAIRQLVTPDLGERWMRSPSQEALFVVGYGVFLLQQLVDRFAE